MARFMDVHSGFFGVTEEQLLEAHRRDQAIEGEESVLRIHERAGHPTNEIYEVPVEVE